MKKAGSHLSVSPKRASVDDGLSITYAVTSSVTLFKRRIESGETPGQIRRLSVRAHRGR